MITEQKQIPGGSRMLKAHASSSGCRMLGVTWPAMVPAHMAPALRRSDWLWLLLAAAGLLLAVATVSSLFRC